ncbi:hypothetical protein [Bordetella genomosp. 11]|uniref:Uncharacterized protein n=1 Tax=Bordetella genomosp. 11 TaxID=1416808 RepID=A0A261UJS3_9BORD|nr:hypothetical protein [Bordetella genomosp. 11]OZI62148.1 hypothetical protein CAL28_23295 [Bordetella genomosp. 11]
MFANLLFRILVRFAVALGLAATCMIAVSYLFGIGVALKAAIVILTGVAVAAYWRSHFLHRGTTLMRLNACLRIPRRHDRWDQ